MIRPCYHEAPCHHIPNDFQYGFQPGHSCQAQLISIIEEIQYALDHHHYVDLILLYINDINVGISSSLRLFADDCVLYRIIESDQDQNCLQLDLNMIFAWSQTLQMQLNVNKCVALRCDRSSQPSSFTYFSGQCTPELCNQTFLPRCIVNIINVIFSSHQ